MRKLISELRRRNVFRVAAAYALSAWILIEAGSVLLPTFGASEDILQFYVLVVIAGFVVSVILAWIFQVTPHGVKLDRDADRAAPVDRRGRQRMNYLIIALLAIALTVSITFNVTSIDVDGGRTATASIAVLPFTSRGDNADNRLFADGIHDDLLTRLANIKALKVISPTSVIKYRDTTKNVREIGEELGVEAILAGTVQRIGDSVRINLQLIDARTDAHLWAETYDHQLTLENIFAVQSRISESVAYALQATLTPEERIRVAAVPTTDLRAYRLYKEGKDNLYQRRLETIRMARQQFQEAVALDPEYSEAHAGLAESVMLLAINHQDIGEQEAMAAAKKSLDRALELDPDLADAYAILGLIKSTSWSHTRMGTENAEAEAAYRRAIALNPNHASAHMWFASLRDAEGRLDEAIDLYERSMELDPLGRIPYANLALIYAKKGQNEAAMHLLLETARIHNEWPIVYQYIAGQLWGMGRLDEAYAWFSRATELTNDPLAVGSSRIGVLIDFGELGRAEAELDALPESNPMAPLAAGLHFMIDGAFGEALQHFVEATGDTDLQPEAGYYFASNAALLDGDLEAAKKYALAEDPLLAGDTETNIDRVTVRNVVKLAFIEQQQGNGQEATRLLNEALSVIRDLPRLGTFGYGIRDVQIYALLGRKEDAIAAFREAMDAGYRGSVFFDGWPLAEDPYLDAIRRDPRFVDMVHELDGHLMAMRDRLLEAESAGDMEKLRGKARSI